MTLNKHRLKTTLLMGSLMLLIGIGSASADWGVEDTPNLSHVFVIIGENTELAQINEDNAPYLLNTLKPSSAWLTQYYATTHFSEANYVAMTSGQYTHCQQQNGLVEPCHQNVDNLFSQMARDHITFKTWSESMPEPCYLSNSGSASKMNTYVIHHNPQVLFDNVEGDTLGGPWLNKNKQGGEFCQSTNVPAGRNGPNDMSIFNNALAGIPGTPSIAEFNLIIPNKCENGHDVCNKGQIQQYDDFLAREVPLIQDYLRKHGGLLIVTFDEGEGAKLTGQVKYGQGGNIVWLAWGPQVQPGIYSHGPYTHYSFLRMLQNGFGLTKKYLGNAAHVLPINGIWKR
jgi:hypothetical protein